MTREKLRAFLDRSSQPQTYQLVVTGYTIKVLAHFLAESDPSSDFPALFDLCNAVALKYT